MHAFYMHIVKGIQERMIDCFVLNPIGSRERERDQGQVPKIDF